MSVLAVVITPLLNHGESCILGDLHDPLRKRLAELA